ncbi:hypothetical protein J6590_066792 [Homalodisca vitripennis]|nr:hypothetical protein J6590_066792 [Homalodisca vitripennis]
MQRTQTELEAGISLNQNQCPTSKTAWQLIRYKVDRTVKMQRTQTELEAGISLNQNQCPTSKTAWQLIRYKVDRTVKNATDTNRIGSWDIVVVCCLQRTQTELEAGISLNQNQCPTSKTAWQLIRTNVRRLRPLALIRYKVDRTVKMQRTQTELEAGISLNQNQCPTSKTAWQLIRYKVDRTVKNATDTNRIGSWDISESEPMSDV